MRFKLRALNELKEIHSDNWPNKGQTLYQIAYGR